MANTDEVCNYYDMIWQIKITQRAILLRYYKFASMNKRAVCNELLALITFMNREFVNNNSI